MKKKKGEKTKKGNNRKSGVAIDKKFRINKQEGS